MIRAPLQNIAIFLVFFVAMLSWQPSRLLAAHVIQIPADQIVREKKSVKPASLERENIKVIVVDASPGVTVDNESPDHYEIWKLLHDSRTSHVLSRENIKQTAIDFLRSRLNDIVKVEAAYVAANDRTPGIPSSLILRLDYTVTPQLILGGRALIGVIAVSVQPGLDIKSSNLTNSAKDWQPLEAFVIGATEDETQRNLEAAIARLLSRYVK